MSRSQRHKVIVQGTDSAGKGLSEKQPAIVYIRQYAASQAFTVPIGSSGGPLQGASTAGFPPTLIPAPGVLAERDGELLEGEGGFGDPGQFNLSGNPIHTDLPAAGESGGELPPPDGGGETSPDPEPGLEPTLTSLDPDTAVLGDADFTLRCLGTNFTETSTIRFAMNEEPIEFVSDTEITTTVKPSLPWGAVTVPVTVIQGSFETQPLDFIFTEPEEPPVEPPVELETSGGTSELPWPEGPVGILKIEKVGENLLVTVEAADFQTGDWVRIEATGNTALNGDYRIGTVKGATITISGATIELLSNIDGRGRVTLLERA